jgi:hypothetical protein
MAGSAILPAVQANFTELGGGSQNGLAVQMVIAAVGKRKNRQALKHRRRVGRATAMPAPWRRQQMKEIKPC